MRKNARLSTYSHKTDLHGDGLEGLRVFLLLVLFCRLCDYIIDHYNSKNDNEDTYSNRNRVLQQSTVKPHLGIWVERAIHPLKKTDRWLRMTSVL